MPFICTPSGPSPPAADAASCSMGVVTSAWVNRILASFTVASIGTQLAVRITAESCLSAQFPDDPAEGKSATACIAATNGIHNRCLELIVARRG